MKSELEKMLAGELYNANDPELVQMRLKARSLFAKYNQTLAENTLERKLILKQLFAETGEQIDIQTPFYCDYGSNIYAGENLFINFNCTILDCAKVTLGKNVFLAPNVQLYAAHPSLGNRTSKLRLKLICCHLPRPIRGGQKKEFRRCQ